MAVNGLDFYKIAAQSHELATEIGYRNCVSRAYYSMYHVVLEILTNSVPNYATGGSHHCLIEYLADSRNQEPHDKKELRRLSYILRQQRDLRCDAAYEIRTNKITYLTAEEAIHQASRVADICQGLSKAA